jgi:hypothetical protein
MRTSPSRAPHGPDRDTYMVLDDFGSLGRTWQHGVRPTKAGANRATLVRNLLDGQYESPARIIAFNTAEGWSRDVTVDIADELRRRMSSTTGYLKLCWPSWKWLTGADTGLAKTDLDSEINSQILDWKRILNYRGLSSASIGD